jgi:hypothetical protein
LAWLLARLLAFRLEILLLPIGFIELLLRAFALRLLRGLIVLLLADRGLLATTFVLITLRHTVLHSRPRLLSRFRT